MGGGRGMEGAVNQSHNKSHEKRFKILYFHSRDTHTLKHYVCEGMCVVP